MNAYEATYIGQAYGNITQAYMKLRGLAKEVTNKSEHDFLVSMASHIESRYSLNAYTDIESSFNLPRDDLLDDVSINRMNIDQLTELSRISDHLWAARKMIEELSGKDSTPEAVEYIRSLPNVLNEDHNILSDILRLELDAKSYPRKVVSEHALQELDETLLRLSKLVHDLDVRDRATEDDADSDSEDAPVRVDTFNPSRIPTPSDGAPISDAVHQVVEGIFRAEEIEEGGPGFEDANSSDFEAWAEEQHQSEPSSASATHRRRPDSDEPSLGTTMPTHAEDFDVFLAADRGHVVMNRRRPDTVDDGPVSDVVRQVVQETFDAEEAAQILEIVEENADYARMADEQQQADALEGVVAVVGHRGTDPHSDHDLYEVAFARNGKVETAVIEMSVRLGSPEYVGIYAGGDIGGAEEYAAADRAVELDDFATIDEALAAQSDIAMAISAHRDELEPFLRGMTSEIEASILPHHDRIHPDAAMERAEHAADNERDVVKADADGRLDIHQVDDVYSAVVPIPEEIQKDYNIADLKDCGVEIEDGDKFVLMVTADEYGIAMVRQHDEPGFQKRFETAMHEYYATQMNEDVQQVRKQAAAVEIAATPVQKAASVTAEYHSPAYDNQHGNTEVYKIAVDGEDLAVNVRFDDAYRVVSIDLNETDSDYDFERDGADRGIKLESIVADHRDSVVNAINDTNVKTFENRLQQAGWSGDDNLKAGYCVISQGEIDRIKAAAADEKRLLFREQGSTTDGRPVNLTFDGRGNIETASPQGFAIQLKPVLENSRDHFIEVKAQLSDRDITVTKNTEGDYRVDYRAGTSGHVRGGEGSSNPHCEDVSEAVYTAKDMIASRDSQKSAQMDAIWKAANDTSLEDEQRRRAIQA